MTSPRANGQRRYDRRLLAVWLLVLIPISGRLLTRRQVQSYRQSIEDPSHVAREALSTGELVGASILGGFRPILINILWVRALNRMADRDVLELPIYFKAIQELQSNSPAIYWIQAKFMALDIPRIVADHQDERWKWIVRGVEVQELGRRRFPSNTELLVQGASLYYARFLLQPPLDDRARFLRDREANPTGSDPVDIAIDYMEEALKNEDHEEPDDILMWGLLSTKVHLLLGDRQGNVSVDRLQDAEARRAFEETVAKGKRLLRHSLSEHERSEELVKAAVRWRDELKACEEILKVFEKKAEASGTIKKK